MRGTSKKRSKQFRHRRKVRKMTNKVEEAQRFVDNLEECQSNLDTDSESYLLSDVESENSVIKVVESESSEIQVQESEDSAKLTVDVEKEVCDLTTESGILVVDKIREWVVNCKIPHKHADKLLKILKANVLPNIPACTTTLLKNSIKCNKETMIVSDGTIGEFCYFGIKERLEKTVDPRNHDANILELIINIDGVSPFKSSTVTMWPTLCKVYTKEDVYKPFSASVYAGHGKPKSAADYLDKFVEEINSLQATGVNVNEKHFEVRIKFFSCDCPARSFLKCVLGHTAFKGCERCKVLGEKKDFVTVFLQTNAEKKTDSDFRAFEDADYHTGASLLTLIEPKINMLNQFVLDPMHLLYLGCMKRILEFWLGSSSNYKSRLSATMKEELQRRSKEIQKDIPDEFPRKMRPINDSGKYKAVEYKFFAQYAAMFLLKKILPKEQYEHLLLFTMSCRLLSAKDPLHHVDQVRQNLIKFVNDAPHIFGSTFVSLNIHNLIHVPDDVEYTGCNLNELSAFTFESYLGNMTSLMRSPLNLVAQYNRRLFEQENYAEKVTSIPNKVVTLVATKQKIVKISYKGMILSINDPNSTFLTPDGNVAEIIEFCRASSSVNIKYKMYLKKLPVIPQYNDQNIWEVKKLSSDILFSSLEKVSKKLIKFKMNFSSSEEKRFFVIPFLH